METGPQPANGDPWELGVRGWERAAGYTAALAARCGPQVACQTRGLLPTLKQLSLGERHETVS